MNIKDKQHCETIRCFSYVCTGFTIFFAQVAYEAYGTPCFNMLYALPLTVCLLGLYQCYRAASAIDKRYAKIQKRVHKPSLKTLPVSQGSRKRPYALPPSLSYRAQLALLG